MLKERDSGWALKKLTHLHININKYNPIGGSSYIPLPAWITRKKAVINIKNNDQCCFKWSILAHLHSVEKDTQRVSKYLPYANELNFDGIEFPVNLCDVGKFEQLNDISVNLFGVGNKEIIGPLYFTKQRRAKHVNLLLISDNQGNSHYCLIKNLSRLVSSQINSHKNAKFICDGCLQKFPTYEALQAHMLNDCGHVTVKLPSPESKKNWVGEDAPGNILEFQNYAKKMRVPFVIYADFESILEPVHQSTDSATTMTHVHKPHSFAYYIKCDFDDSHSKFVTYRGIDCSKKFIEYIEADVRRIYHDYLETPVPMQPLTPEQEKNFKEATVCHICEKPLGEDRVRDHSHLPPGLFVSAAHSKCNLNYKIPKFIPVFLHNLSRYDAHLFFEDLATEGSHIDVVPQTKETYISFTKKIFMQNDDEAGKNSYIQLRFLDSYRFLASSIDELAKNLSDDECKTIRKAFPRDDEFNLLRKKGVFPYEFVDSYGKLNYDKIPDKSKFYSSMTNSDISESDYLRAKLVWKTFHCQNLGEYSDIYLKTDVLLLTDIFENFRDVCLRTYKLDPAHYYTAPGLSWDAMLKYTGVKLELLTDIDMVHFFKKGIRGGVAMCTKRYAKANNKFMKDFNPSNPSSYIMYLDATNLYGAAMSEYLPQSDFQWVENVENFDLASIPDNNSIGYVLEVDLEYPSELHNLHNDLPLCPEKMKSPIRITDVEKLIPNLYDKKKYIIHYKNLKQALSLGLKLTKIHRILQFKQSAWLKPYIDLNTTLRNSAKNKFEKNFYKLKNNAVFGKTMENVEKRRDVKICTMWENEGRRVGAGSLIASPLFKDSMVINENFVIIEMQKSKIVYDKPIYTGFSILDLSKTIMYEFYYNYLKTKYGENINLLYTDTDSVIIEVFTENIYEDIKDDLDRFDTSNYPSENSHNIPKNESKLGKMKDEYADVIIVEFCGTGAKAYCVGTEDSCMKKAKGVKQSVVEKNLMMEHYKKIVFEDHVHYEQNMCFRSNKHCISTNCINKIALSKFDDKRFVLNDKVNTLAIGHYKICGE